ncbi:MAG: Omp28-related outer membrane protein [Marinifilaceae bacterium]|jgi:thiol-disulfide isomerase/thioredoxin|nr:Omp28-related outer membrane protein [Marinifilaceae bacterium]
MPYIYFILILALISSCTKKKNDYTKQNELVYEKENTQFSKFKIKSDKYIISNNNIDTISLTAYNDQNKHIKEGTIYYINNQAIKSNHYSFSEEGIYNIWAENRKYNSDTIKVFVINSNLQYRYIVKPSKTQLICDGKDSIVIRVYDNEQKQEVKSNISYYINDVNIGSNTLKTDKSGLSEIKVKINNFISDPIKIFAFEKFEKRYLVESFLADWCGHCPKLINTLEQHDDDYRIIPVSIHCEDKISKVKSSLLRYKFNIRNYPVGIKDRKERILNSKLETISNTSDIGIGIKSEKNKDNLLIKVKLFSQQNLYHNLRLVVYLLENKIEGIQYNFLSKDENYKETRFYNLPFIIEHYLHNHVLIKSLTKVFGDKIQLNRNKESNMVNYKVNLNQIHSQEYEIVAFVVDMDNEGKIINAQKSPIWEDINM